MLVQCGIIPDGITWDRGPIRRRGPGPDVPTWMKAGSSWPGTCIAVGGVLCVFDNTLFLLLRSLYQDIKVEDDVIGDDAMVSARNRAYCAAHRLRTGNNVWTDIDPWGSRMPSYADVRAWCQAIAEAFYDRTRVLCGVCVCVRTQRDVFTMNAVLHRHMQLYDRVLAHCETWLSTARKQLVLISECSVSTEPAPVDDGFLLSRPDAVLVRAGSQWTAGLVQLNMLINDRGPVLTQVSAVSSLAFLEACVQHGTMIWGVDFYDEPVEPIEYEQDPSERLLFSLSLEEYRTVSPVLPSDSDGESCSSDDTAADELLVCSLCVCIQWLHPPSSQGDGEGSDCGAHTNVPEVKTEINSECEVCSACCIAFSLLFAQDIGVIDNKEDSEPVDGEGSAPTKVKTEMISEDEVCEVLNFLLILLYLYRTQVWVVTRTMRRPKMTT